MSATKTSFTTPIVNPKSQNTLPRLGFFVGCKKELQTIVEALFPDPRTWGALIDGPGGVGKTALAVKAAHDAPKSLFERKIFITAKVRKLTPEDEQPLTDFTRPAYLAMLDKLGKELGVDGLEKLPPEARANELRLALAGKQALIAFDNLETFPEDERTRLFQFLSRLLTGDNDRLQTVCRQLLQFLNFTGRWDGWLWLTEQAEARALAAKDRKHAGWRAYQAGWMYSLRNQPDLVLACAARAAEHWKDSAPRLKAIAIQLRGAGHRLKKDYPAAIAAYRKVLEIDRSISPESDDVAIALNSLAEVERENKDYPAAERHYREVLRIAKIIKNDEYIANFTGSLAELALDREQWAEAETLAREALALAEKVGRQELIASDCHRIAKALLRRSDCQSDLQEALSFARRAVEIFTRLRYHDLQEAQETQAEIEQALRQSP